MENLGSECDNELEIWLTDIVGLSGRKLAACLKACDDALIEDVNDLRKQHSIDGSLRDLLPMAVATLVKEALENIPADIIATKSKARPTNDANYTKRENAKSNDTKRTQQTTDLPTNKHYAAFLSHKKVSSVPIFDFGCSYHPYMSYIILKPC